MSSDSNAPGLNILASSYDVLRGKYADVSSVKQTILDWDKGEWKTEDLIISKDENKKISLRVPKSVNFYGKPNSYFSTTSGKSTSDYVKSLAVHAGLEGEYSFFSGSVSADYTQEQQNSLSNAYTRVTYLVTKYILSLPSIFETRGLLRDGFKAVLNSETVDPREIYEEYGTHLVRSTIMGGRATFTSVTDTREYKSDVSIEAAAELSAQFAVVSMKAKLSTEEQETAKSFNSASTMTVITKGGDAQYGTKDFLDNEPEWAASVIESLALIDFENPAFIPLWRLADTRERQEVLQGALNVYIESYKPDLGVKGPYLETKKVTLSRPIFSVPKVYDPYYYTTIYWNDKVSVDATIVAKIVPGALAPVTWEIIYTKDQVRIWKAKPLSDDYIALSHVVYRGTLADDPPAGIAERFRAVHKSVVEPTHFLGAIDMLHSPDVNGWVVDSDGIFFGFTDMEKPLDKPYKLKVSETRPYVE